MSDVAHAFTHALVRAPSDSATAGLRAVDVGAPDVARFRRDHAAYVAALEAAGVAVTVLPPLEAYPDATFIEDVALCLPRVAVLLVPGAPSRRGEVGSVRAPLAAFYRDVLALGGEAADGTGGGRSGAPRADESDTDAGVDANVEAGAGEDGDGTAATIEGGDVLVTPEEVLVGLSARTNAAGARALARLLEPFGHTVRVVRTPPGVLHFKSDCSLLDGRTVLATERLAASGCFGGYRVVTTAAGEEPAANAVRVNDRVLFPAGHPRTAARLREAGYRVHELDNGEGAKLDGGMSCLSLRFGVAEDAAA